MTSKTKGVMEKFEIEKLLTLKGWSRTDLASEMGVTENAVHRWMAGTPKPRGPAAILMRLWLDAAEAELRDEKQKNGKKALAGAV